MKEEYKITPQDLEKKGLILSQYALDTTFIQPIIEIALGLAITRILNRNDDFKYEEDVEHELDKNPKLVEPFKKLQYQIIYNLVFLGDNDPINVTVDNIISCDLRWCKINGWQKQVY